MVAIAILGLLICACAPSLPWLLPGTALTGLFSVVAGWGSGRWPWSYGEWPNAGASGRFKPREQ